MVEKERKDRLYFSLVSFVHGQSTKYDFIEGIILASE